MCVCLVSFVDVLAADKKCVKMTALKMILALAFVGAGKCITMSLSLLFGATLRLHYIIVDSLNLKCDMPAFLYRLSFRTHPIRIPAALMVGTGYSEGYSAGEVSAECRRNAAENETATPSSP